MKQIKSIYALFILFLLIIGSNIAASNLVAADLRKEVVQDLTGNILPFWVKYAVDPAGGFYGMLANDGTPHPDAVKGAVLNARLLWTFSSAYRLLGDKSYKVLADRAQRYFIDHFLDLEQGGVYWSLHADGSPADSDKQTYGCSFGIYGLSEHYRATGNEESLRHAIVLYQTMESKVREPRYDGYIESFTRDWQKPAKYGYDGSGLASKTMNTHIHILEAYTSLYRVWKDGGVRSRLHAMIGLLKDRVYNPDTRHLRLYFDTAWNSLEDIDSYGHDIETSWLLSEAAEVLGDQALRKEIDKMAVDMVDTALKEGMNSDGSLIYERHKDISRRELSWWCQAETVLGCVNAWRITGNSLYLDAAAKTWGWICDHMIDKSYGEWYGTVTEEGEPVLKGQKASMWRCPYHNSRMGFELYTRLADTVPPVSQTEVMAWGNMTGIRMDGQLMAFESSLRVVGKDWATVQSTGKEKQDHPLYHRDGDQQIVRTVIDRVHFEQTVTDKTSGKAIVSLSVQPDTTFASEGVYFCLDLPAKKYASGSVRIGKSILQIGLLNGTDANKPPKYTGSSIRIEGVGCMLQLDFSSSVTAFLRKEPGSAATLYVALGAVKKGKQISRTFTIQADGEMDHQPAEITLDTANPGRLFTGLGGNFRLQNPRVDPMVIDYCLNNLRVAWGRVEMPWRIWQPEENSDPIADARKGEINGRVKSAMQMTRRLKTIGMPVIVSAWFPPLWAIDGDPDSYVSRGGIQAFRLDPAKQQVVYKSIADYLVYLKQAYGVEAAMFSFNESDLGIDILHTPQEHADFIKGLGAYFASRGLETKLLLGDNSDATTFDFILPALYDEDTHKYIGAISFHSWRGCDDATLRKWATASRTLNVPLVIGEGSTDAAAHKYSEIFAESTFALYEINLYTRICAICQPLSILQWQLTSDYSLLWGEGVYGSTGPLRPTQRFWNLKQLASTPEDAFAIPLQCDKEEINCAAFGNIARGKYAVHMVNNGAAREVKIKGFPSTVSELKYYVTNAAESMSSHLPVRVVNGVATLNVPSASFITLLNE